MRKWLIAGVAAAALVITGAGGAAGSAARSVSFADPADAEQTFNRPQDPDLSAVTVTYDPAGSITVLATFHNDGANRPYDDLLLDFTLGATLDPYRIVGCDGGAGAPRAWGAIAFGEDLWGFLYVDGFSDSLRATSVAAAPDGKSVSAVFSHGALAGRDYRCAAAGDLSTSIYTYSWCKEYGCPRDSLLLDAVDQAKWFPGYAPKPKPKPKKRKPPPRRKRPG